MPIKPLEPAELGSAWAESWATVRRYHEFFRACKPAIAAALGVPPSGSLADRVDWTWQDFIFDDGTRLCVGLACTDDGLVKQPTHAPIVWIAPRADHLPDWPDTTRRLHAHPPAGWNAAPRRWYDRPNAWRYLADIIGTGTFDEQRDRLATAALAGRAWARLTASPEQA